MVVSGQLSNVSFITSNRTYLLILTSCKNSFSGINNKVGDEMEFKSFVDLERTSITCFPFH